MSGGLAGPGLLSRDRFPPRATWSSFVTPDPERKIAALIHARVSNSTELVQINRALAHQRIQSCFKGFEEVIDDYGGVTHEQRGDFMNAEFRRLSAAICAALSFQAAQKDFVARLQDDIGPEVRIGIALGEVLVAETGITGAGLILARRLEQLAPPGGVVIQGAARDTLPRDLPFTYRDLGKPTLSGMNEPVHVFEISLARHGRVPEPAK